MGKRWSNFNEYKFVKEQEVVEHADEVEWHALSFFMDTDGFTRNFFRQFKHELDWELLDISQKDDNFKKEFSEFLTY